MFDRLSEFRVEIEGSRKRMVFEAWKDVIQGMEERQHLRTLILAKIKKRKHLQQINSKP